NPRLRLREFSKGRELVEVVASHGTLLWLGPGKMVRAVGFEPTTSWFQARSAARLRYALKVDHPAGLEPATSRPATGCSAPAELWMDSEDRRRTTKDGYRASFRRPSSVLYRLIGGRLRNRTPDLAVTLVFGTSRRPFSGAFRSVISDQ